MSSHAPARSPQELNDAIDGGIGESPLRPDGAIKVRGEFAYASDLWAEDMLWGATLRSPHPYARIKSIDVGPALKTAGVHAVLTAADVPGENRYGLKYADQPVLAEDVVRYKGEAVALLAADHPETARRALERIEVEYEVLEPVADAERAAHDDSLPKLHPGGNVVRHQTIVRGDPDAEAEIVVSGVYTVGMQDQAFLGPESGLALPAEDGGVDLYLATQDLHSDRRQTAAALDLPEEKVRMTLSGVGGAFGGREDLSIQVHVCMLAMHVGKPVKMVYNREESFYGHVHRHPAKMYYEHGATRDGKLVYVKARQYFDGGAYASKTPVVVGNASTLGAGPYKVPNVHIESWGLYTNNPPCGAGHPQPSAQRVRHQLPGRGEKIAGLQPGRDPGAHRSRHPGGEVQEDLVESVGLVHPRGHDHALVPSEHGAASSALEIMRSTGPAAAPLRDARGSGPCRSSRCPGRAASPSPFRC